MSNTYDHLEGFQILSERIKLNSDKLDLIFQAQTETLKYIRDGRRNDHAYLEGRLDILADLIKG